MGSLSAILLALLALPLIALAWRAVLGALDRPLAGFDAPILDAITLSLSTTALSTLLITLLGTPVAYVFARYRFPFKRALNVLVELPIVMPPVVAGLALLMAFGRRGLLGGPLSRLGIALPFTTAAVILAQVFVAAPFYIRAAQHRFQAIPRELEQAAAIDGAGTWRVFTDVLLPLSWHGLLAGLILSWARALGEFGATILFAGNLRGRTQTMPLLVYGALERDLTAALWAGVLLIALAVAALVLIRALARALSDDEADPLAE
jgi:molybdate transport system permease protein